MRTSAAGGPAGGPAGRVAELCFLACLRVVASGVASLELSSGGAQARWRSESMVAQALRLALRLLAEACALQDLNDDRPADG